VSLKLIEYFSTKTVKYKFYKYGRFMSHKTKYISTIYIKSVGRDSVVGIATRWELGGLGIESR
jgi:hypothetical protein